MASSYRVVEGLLKNWIARSTECHNKSPASSSAGAIPDDYLFPTVETDCCCSAGEDCTVDDDEPPSPASSSDSSTPCRFDFKAPITSSCPLDDFASSVDEVIESLSGKLREMSLVIHAHPEIGFQEHYAHDLLTDFMSSQGFRVTRHYMGLDTAWRAEYTYGRGGQTLGINSEMDALKGIGHACGHNLIAVSGCGIAVAVKAALQSRNVAGKVVLLGTPAEEDGAGKAILLERGAYKDMDLCIMSHPVPGPSRSFGTPTTKSLQRLEVEYSGQASHAGAAPWEGTNALDAAFMAYSGISVLRQQIKPDHRVHGIIQGKDWTANVIPDYAKMQWIVRAPTFLEATSLAKRVENCFNGAALSTSCTADIKVGRPYYDLHQNETLAEEFAAVSERLYGLNNSITAPSGASTDFGNVSYNLPSLHPAYSITTATDCGNHTEGFARCATTPEAHEMTMAVTKALARTGFRALHDRGFLAQIVQSFKASQTSSASL